MEPIRFSSPSAIGHAYILSSPSREEALAGAREIASAAVCLNGHDVPCGKCRGCRKAAAGVHPDIFTLRRLPDKSGNLRRELTVSQIRDLSVDADEIRELIRLILDNDVSVTHFQDLIEDFLEK